MIKKRKTKWQWLASWPKQSFGSQSMIVPLTKELYDLWAHQRIMPVPLGFEQDVASLGGEDHAFASLERHNISEQWQVNNIGIYDDLASDLNWDFHALPVTDFDSIEAKEWGSIGDFEMWWHLYHEQILRQVIADAGLASKDLLKIYRKKSKNINDKFPYNRQSIR